MSAISFSSSSTVGSCPMRVDSMPFAISLIRSVPLARWYLSIEVAASAWRPQVIVSFRLAPVATAAVMDVARRVWKCKSGRPAVHLASLKWSRNRLGVMCVPSAQVTKKSVGFLPLHAELMSLANCGGTGCVVLLVGVFVVFKPPFSSAEWQTRRVCVFRVPVLDLQ